MRPPLSASNLPSEQAKNLREIAAWCYQTARLAEAAAFLQAASLIEINATLGVISNLLPEK